MEANPHSATSTPELEVLPQLIEATQSFLLADQQLPPVVLFTKDKMFDTVGITDDLGLDINSAEDKKKLTGFIKAACLQRDVDSCIMMSEAWITKINAPSAGEALEKLRNRRVSDLPASQRTEVVILIMRVFRPTCERWLGSFDIIRDTTGQICSFGPVVWNKEQGNSPLMGVLLF